MIFKWNSELLEASSLKLSKETGWSQINIWSLTAVDFLDLNRLFVKGEIPECSPTLTLTCRHFKVRVGEHSGISPLTNKRFKSRKSTAVKDHMLICDQPVSFDDFKVLASSNSEFHLKIKESLLISRDQPVLNKNEASLPLHLFD